MPSILHRPKALLLGLTALAVTFMMPVGLLAAEGDSSSKDEGPTLSDAAGDGQRSSSPC